MSATVSGAPFPADLSAGVAAPLESVLGEGALHFMARELRLRLERIFPPPRFDHQWMDGRITKAQWTSLTRRMPTVALGWGGVTPSPRNQNVFEGVAHFMLALVTRNPAGPEARLLGDKLAPGALALTRAAVLGLSGYLIDPEETPWSASGPVEVRTITPLYDEGWLDEAIAVSGLELSVLYEETVMPSLGAPSLLDAIAMQWDFAAGASWSDTWQRST